MHSLPESPHRLPSYCLNSQVGNYGVPDLTKVKITHLDNTSFLWNLTVSHPRSSIHMGSLLSLRVATYRSQSPPKLASEVLVIPC